MNSLFLAFAASVPVLLAQADISQASTRGILGWIILGLVAGAIAKLLTPGRDPGGWIVTILLGIAGSFLGGFLYNVIFGGSGPANLIGSIIGAIILLLIYRVVAGRRGV